LIQSSVEGTAGNAASWAGVQERSSVAVVLLSRAPTAPSHAEVLALAVIVNRVQVVKGSLSLPRSLAVELGNKRNFGTSERRNPGF
jgi:hypothetical protein